MRSTSSGRRRLAAGFCALLAAVPASPPALAGERVVPSLVLAFHGPGLEERAARACIDEVSRRLLADLRVVWVRLPAQTGQSGRGPDGPEADGAAIARISAKLAEAARLMERMETAAAETLLDQAEREARAFRPAEVLRPYLADTFLRRGLLLLWGGNRAGAEELFGRSRALRPDFTPDPALYSPAFRESWARAAARPPAGAEILVQTIPPGADILVDGRRAGTTPARVRVPVLAPVVVRVARPGYVAVERAGHWLPGDSEMIDITLERDRLFRLEELLVESGGGREAGALLAEMATAAGAERVAVFVLTGAGEAGRARVLSLGPGDEVPRVAGDFEWGGSGEGTGDAAANAAAMLKEAGWPAVSPGSREGSAWYHKWWIWLLLGAAIAGAAVGGGGNGGASGGSTGAIGVNF